MRQTGRGGRRLVYGVHAVEELLLARPQEVHAVFVADVRLDGGLAQRLAAASLSPEKRPSKELDRLAAGGRHQGVVALVGEYPYQTLEELLGGWSAVEAGDQPAAPAGPIVVLDQVQDPRNLGAVARSAWALGSAGLVLPRRRSAQVTAAAVRTSAGATEHLPICRVVNLVRGLEEMSAAGWWLVGATGRGGDPPEALDLADRVALVLGSEARGLRPSTERRCDLRVSIPMVGGLDSLNVSVAAGILLAEAARQRRRGQ